MKNKNWIWMCKTCSSVTIVPPTKGKMECPICKTPMSLLEDEFDLCELIEEKVEEAKENGFEE